MKLGTEEGLGPGHSLRWGPSSPQRGTASKFLTHVCCGQKAGWIKMPLGREVDLGPGDIVLDGNQLPALPQTVAAQFSAHVLWPNG